MFCPNCGATSNIDSRYCPNCGCDMNTFQQTTTAYNNINTNNFNTNNINTTPCNDIPTTSILVFTILELLCCNMICGIIALVFYFSQLKPALQSGNRENALNSKKTIKLILWVGLGLSLLLNIITFTLFGGKLNFSLFDFSIKTGDTSQQSSKATSSYISEDYDYDYDYNYDYDWDSYDDSYYNY